MIGKDEIVAVADENYLLTARYLYKRETCDRSHIMRKQDGVLSAPGLDLRIPGPYQAKAAWPLEHSPKPHPVMRHAPYSQATPVYLQRTIDPHRSNK